jgi:hypothetical protein
MALAADYSLPTAKLARIAAFTAPPDTPETAV